MALVIASTGRVAAEASTEAPAPAVGLAIHHHRHRSVRHAGAQRRVRERGRDRHLPGGLDVGFRPLQPAPRDRAGGGGTFSASCTGTAQVARSRAVNGNRFTLGNWNASAYVTIARSGQTARADTARTIRLEPGVTARVADQGQLTGTTGGGVRLAVAVACPIGATGQQSSVTVSQGHRAGTGVLHADL